jgi:hypothetical protein
MDRYSGEKDGDKIQKLILVVLISGLLGCCLHANALYAADETQQQEENKVEIEVEKQSIVVKVERPSLIFPVRWKDPDIPEEREYILKKDFSEEIKKIIDIGNQ